MNTNIGRHDYGRARLLYYKGSLIAEEGKEKNQKEKRKKYVARKRETMMATKERRSNGGTADAVMGLKRSLL